MQIIPPSVVSPVKFCCLNQQQEHEAGRQVVLSAGGARDPAPAAIGGLENFSSPRPGRSVLLCSSVYTSELEEAKREL